MTKFNEKLLKALETRLGGDYSVLPMEKLRLNGCKESGLTIRQQSCSVAPMIYTGELERQYIYGIRSLEEITDMIADDIIKQKDDRRLKAQAVANITSFEAIKKQIRIKFVNTEKNQELLEGIPHFEFLDLSGIYYLALGDDSEGIMTTTIGNQMVQECWKIDAITLYQTAMENMVREMPAEIWDMETILAELMGATGFLSEDFMSTDEHTPKLYVLSNRKRVNGAVEMILPNVIRDFADQLKSDLYILPSSVHELLLLKKEPGSNVAELKEMVVSINATEVASEDLLSDNVYQFRREIGRVEIAC